MSVCFLWVKLSEWWNISDIKLAVWLFIVLKFSIIIIFKLLIFMETDFWTLALRPKWVLWNHHCQSVSRSVSKSVIFFLRNCSSIFLKLCMKLKHVRGKTLTKPDFFKKSQFGGNAQKCLKNNVFWLLQKI